MNNKERSLLSAQSTVILKPISKECDILVHGHRLRLLVYTSSVHQSRKDMKKRQPSSQIRIRGNVVWVIQLSSNF